MKLSKLLKRYADYLTKFYPYEDFEVLACIDIYEIALTCQTAHGKSYYHICTLRFDKSYYFETLDCYFDDKKAAEKAYNILIKYAKIRNENMDRKAR